MQEIRSHRDAIIEALRTYGRVSHNSDPNAPEATIGDTIRFVDGLILGTDKVGQQTAKDSAPSSAEMEGQPEEDDSATGDQAQGITCRDDFNTGDKKLNLKRRSDFIANYGLSAFEDLPQHRVVQVLPDQMCREDLEGWTSEARSTLINELGGEQYAAIWMRRRTNQ